MSAMKRALEEGAVLIETEQGDEGKPIIRISLPTLGQVIIYESLVEPGILVMECDDIGDMATGGKETFPGIDALRPIPGLRVYRNDRPIAPKEIL